VQIPCANNLTMNACAPRCQNNDAACWMCFGEGPDESGQPLRRDCSCRGPSAGFVHVSCLVEYAESKSRQHDDNDSDLNEFVSPWRFCPTCCQPYENELATELATRFETFAENEYPNDPLKHLEALYLKLQSLRRRRRSLRPRQMEEAKSIPNKMLSVLKDMKTSNHSLSLRAREAEARTYNSLGLFAFEEGTKQSLEKAMEHFETFRDISESIGSTLGVTYAETNLALAKSNYKKDNNASTEECQELYKRCVDAFGKGNPHSIQTGVNLAVSLRKANRTIEAQGLLKMISATSKQVHGPNHKLTKKAESVLQRCNNSSNDRGWGLELQLQFVLSVTGSGRKFCNNSHEDQGWVGGCLEQKLFFLWIMFLVCWAYCVSVMVPVLIDAFLPQKLLL